MEQRAQRVAVKAGEYGWWTVETAQAFVAQADTMTEDDMTFWENAVDRKFRAFCAESGDAQGVADNRR